MKIYYYYDDAFVDMKNMFERSFKDDFEACPVHTSSIDPGIIHAPMLQKETIGGGLASWLTKVGIILKAIEQAELNEVFVMSDIDIVFYQPVIPTINKCINDHSLCLQRESVDRGGVNIGFMAIRCDEPSRQFWTAVRDEIILTERWDQETVNRLLNLGFPIKWTTFPVNVWNYTQRKILPRDMILHHANAAKTQQDKMDQFRKVREHWRRAYYLPVDNTTYSS